MAVGSSVVVAALVMRQPAGTDFIDIVRDGWIAALYLFFATSRQDLPRYRGDLR